MRHEQQPGRALMTRWFSRKINWMLKQGDLTAVEEELQCHWPVPLLIDFLGCGQAEVRELAAMSLVLIGDRSAVTPLVQRLHDSEVKVAEAADHALWAIWFRGGSAAARGHLKCGAHHLKHGNLETATEKFSLAIAADPECTEAYNQRSIAYYLTERYVESIHDCLQTLERMPVHFGAMAGMGHCYVNLGDFNAAKDCYRQVLRIHPRLEGIAASLAQIDEILLRRQPPPVKIPA